MNSNEKILLPSLGFIGLGTIGLPIAANLIDSGYVLQVHTRSRTAERDQRLLGANPCSSPAEAAKGCDILLICVSDDEAVKEVLFGSKGAQNSLKKGSIVVDMSTISPDTARSISTVLSTKDITYVDAPVTGGSEGADAGTLTIFLGANKNILNLLAPVLNSISNEVFTFGEVGKGQEVKAINQILVAGTYCAVAEAIALGQSLNLPMELVVDALKNGAAGSWALEHRSKGMLNDVYPLGFKLALHHKDLCIAIKTAKQKGLNLKVTNQVKELEELLIQKGYMNEDISVIKRYLNRFEKNLN